MCSFKFRTLCARENKNAIFRFFTGITLRCELKEGESWSYLSKKIYFFSKSELNVPTKKSLHIQIFNKKKLFSQMQCFQLKLSNFSKVNHADEAHQCCSPILLLLCKMWHFGMTIKFGCRQCNSSKRQGLKRYLIYHFNTPYIFFCMKMQNG